jgi:hypothetical protein
MAASHPEMFKRSTINKEEILKLVDDHLISPQAILQWWPVKK